MKIDLIENCMPTFLFTIFRVAFTTWQIGVRNVEHQLLSFTSFRCANSFIRWPPVMSLPLCSCTILSPLSWHLFLYKPVQVAFSQSQTSSTHNLVFLCVLFVRNDTQIKSLQKAIGLLCDASANQSPEIEGKISLAQMFCSRNYLFAQRMSSTTWCSSDTQCVLLDVGV